MIEANTAEELTLLLEGLRNGSIGPNRVAPSPISGASIPVGQTAGTVLPTGGYDFMGAPSVPTRQPTINKATETVMPAAEMLGGLTGRYNQAVTGMVDKAMASPQISAFKSGLGKEGVRKAGQLFGQAGRIPGVTAAAKILPAVGAVGAVLGAADIVAGQSSLANKAMDATAMTVGGMLGAVGGPLGAAAGAGIGKSVSDGVQWLFGDKKTPEQRKMELALANLRGGMV